MTVFVGVLDPSYAGKLLRHAKELFDFAEKFPGKYSDSINDAAAYYRYVLCLLKSGSRFVFGLNIPRALELLCKENLGIRSICYYEK